MRSPEQIKRVGLEFGLDRRRLSILLWKQRQIENQRQLKILALELKQLSDVQCLELLNNRNPVYCSHTLTV